MPFWVYLFPLWGALVGLAVVSCLKLVLFYPRTLVFGSFRIQGVFFKIYEEIFDKIKKKGFLDKEMFEELLDQLDWEKTIIPIMDQKLTQFVDDTKIQMPLIGMFVSGELETILKNHAKQHFVTMIPELKGILATKVIDEVDVATFVQKKFPFSKVESFLKRETQPYFRLAYLAGALIGFLGNLLFLFIYLIFN